MIKYEYIRETLDLETGDILDVDYYDTPEELREAAIDAAAAGEKQYHFAAVREGDWLNGGPKGWAYLQVRLLPIGGGQFLAGAEPAQVSGEALAPEPSGRYIVRSSCGEHLCFLPSKITAQLRRETVVTLKGAP